MSENQIQVNKYVYFDTESGRFCLTCEALSIIYHEKYIICSYSGASEWCNHFVCEMLDLYSGDSQYNYALGSIIHEKRIPEIFKTNKESIIKWVEKSLTTEWSIKMYKMIENIIDDLPEYYEVSK